MKPSVPAVELDDLDEHPNPPPGAFEYFSAGDRQVAGMIYVCPCGCGAQGTLNFRPHPSPSWDWDGNRERPTLAPSVHHQIQRPPDTALKTHWHGWLRNGVWESV